MSKKIFLPLQNLNRLIAAARKEGYSAVIPEMPRQSKEIAHIYDVFSEIISKLGTRQEQRDNAFQKAEDSLRRYQQLADMLPQSIFETNSWGNYTYVNISMVR
jgi:hypothetical protein